MKRILVILFFIFLLFPILRSQEMQHIESSSFFDNVAIGIKGGIHNSQLHYSDYDKYDPQQERANVGGVFAEIKLNKQASFLISPELLFLSRGTEIEQPDFKYTILAEYVDFRIPLAYQFGKEHGVRPYIYAAPTISFVSGGNIKLTDLQDDYRVDVSDANFSTIDFGLMGGIGLRIPIKVAEEKRIFIKLDAAYYLGLTDTYSDQEKSGEAYAINKTVYDIQGTRKFQGWELTASLSIPLSSFKKKKPKVVYIPPAPVQIPVETTYIPAAVIEEEKPCYTLDEINDMIRTGKSIIGKTICAIDVINFEFGKSSLDRKSYQYLDQIVNLMKKSDFNMQIIGHTDNVGSEEFNMNLSKKRAEAVHSYLIKNGVSSSRLSYTYFGMENPIASNNTEEGRLINRRVEFKILNN